jgi:hypothetical protein
MWCLKTKHDIALGNTGLFQPLSDPQVGVVDLQPGR